MPYYVLSEVLAPVFEVLTLVSLGLAVALGVFEWPTFHLAIALVSFVNASLTAIAILADNLQSRLYAPRELLWLLLLAPLDLLVYRPFLVWARLKGTWRFLRGDKGWYRFDRNERAAPLSG